VDDSRKMERVFYQKWLAKVGSDTSYNFHTLVPGLWVSQIILGQNHQTPTSTGSTLYYIPGTSSHTGRLRLPGPANCSPHWIRATSTHSGDVYELAATSAAAWDRIFRVASITSFMWPSARATPMLSDDVSAGAIICAAARDVHMTQRVAHLFLARCPGGPGDAIPAAG